MRLVVDGIIAFVLALVLGAVLLQQQARASELRRVEITQQAVRTIASQALFRGSLEESEVSRRGYPLTIDQNWFEQPPANRVAQAAGGWLDVATEAQSQLLHPEQITTQRGGCAFWYNPYRGIVRARVTMLASDQATVDLYNLVNGCMLRPEDVKREADGER